MAKPSSHINTSTPLSPELLLGDSLGSLETSQPVCVLSESNPLYLQNLLHWLPILLRVVFELTMCPHVPTSPPLTVLFFGSLQEKCSSPYASGLSPPTPRILYAQPALTPSFLSLASPLPVCITLLLHLTTPAFEAHLRWGLL